MKEKTIKASEVFLSFQGEGSRTGVGTVWVRFWLCNLQCNGFAQKDPTDPSTYVLPYQTIDVTSIKRMEDLPVFDKGCDSSYSWSKKFKHLVKEYTPKELVDKIYELLPNNSFRQPNGNMFDLCFTGGEPMLKENQSAMIAIWKEIASREGANERLPSIQIETNGTQAPTDEFKEFFDTFKSMDFPEVVLPDALYFNISPKLFTVSGEKDAVMPSVISQLHDLSFETCIKFVVSNEDRCWDELNSAVSSIREELAKSSFGGYSFWVMPVGASREQQSETEQISSIASKALSLGYHVSARVHTYVFGNAMCT